MEQNQNKLNSEENLSERINLIPLHPTPFADIGYFLNLKENNENNDNIDNNDNNVYSSNVA